jgi:hypothetical protein
MEEPTQLQTFSHLMGEETEPETEEEEIIVVTAPAPTAPKLEHQWFHRRLLIVFGWRFLIFLCVTQLLLKGMAMNIASAVGLPLFKKLLGADASDMQLMMMITRLPWSVKPLFGLLADLTRIGGYHNRYWLLFSLGCGSLCAGCGILFVRGTGNAWGLVLMLMGVNFQIALYDLLSEGCYSARMRDNPMSGSDVVNFVQYMMIGGEILAQLVVGPLSDDGQWTLLFVLLVALCLVPLLPTLLGWLPEEHHGDDQCVALVGREQLNRDAGMIAIIAFTGLAAPAVTLVANTWDAAIGASLALLLCTACIVGAFFLFPTMIARIALFEVLTTLSSPRLGSAMDYFYTADEECFPGGPNFSYAYYMTVAGVIGSIASALGAIFYQLTLSKMRFRSVFIFTILLGSLVANSDLIMVLRLNLRWGISDRWFYLTGEAIMEPALRMLNYIPMSTLLSKNVPKGMESSVFAFQAGIKNFAGLTSSLTGALIFGAAGVRTVAPCNWDALWWLIILCNIALPSLGGVPAAWLIPNKLQTEEL